MDNDWPDYYADPVGHCIAALKYGNEEERFNAADILRGLAADAESAIPFLIEAMQSDEDNQVRAQCAFAISGIGAMIKERAAFAVPGTYKHTAHGPGRRNPFLSCKRAKGHWFFYKRSSARASSGTSR